MSTPAERLRELAQEYEECKELDEKGNFNQVIADLHAGADALNTLTNVCNILKNGHPLDTFTISYEDLAQREKV